MNLKEIVNIFKKGDSTQKLGILSDIVTLFTALIALITSQIFTLKFILDDITFIMIAYYMAAMGLSLLITFTYIKGVSFFIKTYNSYLLKSAWFLLFSAVVILILVTIWSYMLMIL